MTGGPSAPLQPAELLHEVKELVRDQLYGQVERVVDVHGEHGADRSVPRGVIPASVEKSQHLGTVATMTRSQVGVLLFVGIVGCASPDAAADPCDEVKAVEAELIAAAESPPPVVRPPSSPPPGLDEMERIEHAFSDRKRIDDAAREYQQHQRQAVEDLRTLIRQNPDCFTVRERLEAG